MIHPKELESILKRAIDKKVGSLMESKAIEKHINIQIEAKEWKKWVVSKLFRTSKKFKQKDSKRVVSDPKPSDFPYRVTGQLTRAVHYKVSKITQRKGKKTWSFTITNWFSRVSSYSEGQKRVRDYSVILDSSTNKYYSNYKQRLTDRLHESIKKHIR